LAEEFAGNSYVSFRCNSGRVNVDIPNSYVIIGGVVVGASWYLGRLATGHSGMFIIK
jgi:hypothetical protein